MEHGKKDLFGRSETVNVPVVGWVVKAMEAAIFACRWLLAPMYLLLIVALGAYSVKFATGLAHMLKEFRHLEDAQVMLAVLGLLDISMVANLIVTTIIGSYSSFVRKIDFSKLVNRPQGFSHLTAGMLKAKMGMSLVGISSIHLLKKFIEAEHVTWHELGILGSIHCLFILSTIALTKVDLWYHPPRRGGRPRVRVRTLKEKHMKSVLKYLLLAAALSVAGCQSKGCSSRRYHKEKLTAYHLKDGKWVAKRTVHKRVIHGGGSHNDTFQDVEVWEYLVYVDHGHVTGNYYTGAVSPGALPANTTWATAGETVSLGEGAAATSVSIAPAPSDVAVAEAAVDPASVVVESVTVDESGNTAGDNGEAGDGGGEGGASGDSAAGGAGDAGGSGDSGGGGGDGGGD